jgi:hypothetical protein
MNIAAKLKTALLTLALAAGILAAVPPQEALAACLSADQARQVRASGGAASIGQIAGALKQRYQVDVIGGQLCEGGSGYVYELKVLGPGGRADRVVVDARSGQLLSGNLGR